MKSMTDLINGSVLKENYFTTWNTDLILEMPRVEWKGIKMKEGDEMKLGQIVEVKDELNDIFDGEVIMLAPGYSKDDFTVKQINNNEVIVIVKGNDGYKENAEYLFDLDGDYEVEKLDAKVVNGVFTLKANYKINGNVEVKGE